MSRCSPLAMTAEKVAEEACNEAKAYLSSTAAVGAHLADQLLLPMVLAGKGRFTTLAPSLHTQTNIDVIRKFIPCAITAEEREGEILFTLRDTDWADWDGRGNLLFAREESCSDLIKRILLASKPREMKH